uniref:uncharacterized protein LOC120342605 isoform X1 n=1 Tax=Styela clava TaxID=7725 RepID=UPI00193A9B4C|nr:uncharacterized protein LOC120342605 isoform X1 [Styela clava]
MSLVRTTKQLAMSSSRLFFILFAIGAADLAAAKCRNLPLRPIDWTRFSGMWYNTFSYKDDPTQIEGLCNSMVVVGTKGYEGVAVVRNVMPGTANNTEGEEHVLASVPEYFRSLDPGVYQLDPLSQIEWMNIHELEKLMPRNKITSFMNAISKHYTNPFQITAGENFFMIHQCDCTEDKDMVWIYTTNPNLTEEETKSVREHLVSRGIDVELQSNGACFDSLNYIYEKANGIKK